MTNILVTSGVSTESRGVNLVGIENIGNTCYISSTIQFLFANPAIVDIILKFRSFSEMGREVPEKFRQTADKKRFFEDRLKVVLRLRTIFSALIMGSVHDINIESLINEIRRDNNQRFRDQSNQGQMDAAEFQSYLCENLIEGLGMGCDPDLPSKSLSSTFARIVRHNQLPRTVTPSQVVAKDVPPTPEENRPQRHPELPVGFASAEKDVRNHPEDLNELLFYANALTAHEQTATNRAFDNVLERASKVIGAVVGSAEFDRMSRLAKRFWNAASQSHVEEIFLQETPMQLNVNISRSGLTASKNDDRLPLPWGLNVDWMVVLDNKDVAGRVSFLRASVLKFFSGLRKGDVASDEDLATHAEFLAELYHTLFKPAKTPLHPIGFLLHEGNAFGGHYKAMVSSWLNNGWFLCNDAHVAPKSYQEALEAAEGGRGRGCTSAALAIYAQEGQSEKFAVAFLEPNAALSTEEVEAAFVSPAALRATAQKLLLSKVKLEPALPDWVLQQTIDTVREHYVRPPRDSIPALPSLDLVRREALRMALWPVLSGDDREHLEMQALLHIQKRAELEAEKTTRAILQSAEELISRCVYADYTKLREANDWATYRASAIDPKLPSVRYEEDPQFPFIGHILDQHLAAVDKSLGKAVQKAAQGLFNNDFASHRPEGLYVIPGVGEMGEVFGDLGRLIVRALSMGLVYPHDAEFEAVWKEISGAAAKKATSPPPALPGIEMDIEAERFPKPLAYPLPDGALAEGLKKMIKSDKFERRGLELFRVLRKAALVTAWREFIIENVDLPEEFGNAHDLMRVRFFGDSVTLRSSPSITLDRITRDLITAIVKGKAPQSESTVGGSWLMALAPVWSPLTHREISDIPRLIEKDVELAGGLVDLTQSWALTPEGVPLAEISKLDPASLQVVHGIPSAESAAPIARLEMQMFDNVADFYLPPSSCEGLMRCFQFSPFPVEERDALSTLLQTLAFTVGILSADPVMQNVMQRNMHQMASLMIDGTSLSARPLANCLAAFETEIAADFVTTMAPRAPVFIERVIGGVASYLERALLQDEHESYLKMLLVHGNHYEKPKARDDISQLLIGLLLVMRIVGMPTMSLVKAAKLHRIPVDEDHLADSQSIWAELHQLEGLSLDGCLAPLSDLYDDKSEADFGVCFDSGRRYALEAFPVLGIELSQDLLVGNSFKNSSHLDASLSHQAHNRVQYWSQCAAILGNVVKSAARYTADSPPTNISTWIEDPSPLPKASPKRNGTLSPSSSMPPKEIEDGFRPVNQPKSTLGKPKTDFAGGRAANPVKKNSNGSNGRNNATSKPAAGDNKHRR